MAFGVWAIFFGEIGLAASVITATSLGIIVVDTVHFLSKYKRAKIEKNLNTDQALNYAFNTVGPALIITTLVLIIGFSIISLSSFNVNASLGQLTALAVFFALFTDFLLLPGVLKKFDKTKKEQS
jgi:predicted RND superfamily exporter protein